MRKLIGLFLLILSTSTFAYPIDSDISFNVIAQIGRTFGLRYLSIEVTTKNCVVSLVGAAFTNINAERLIQIAASTYGVKAVDISNLSLEYGIPPSIDTIIMGNIKGRFIRERLLCDRCARIKVVSLGGTVHLGGFVTHNWQHAKALSIVNSTIGVLGVVDNIRINYYG